MTFAIPSDVEPSGGGEPGPEVGECGRVCSDSAIVAEAFASPDETGPLPRGGIRPEENLEEVDIRDARDPGRSGDGMLPAAWVSGIDPAPLVGDGGGGGDAAMGGGDGVRVGGAISTPFSAGACARRREREEGPATGVAFYAGANRVE